MMAAIEKRLEELAARGACHSDFLTLEEQSLCLALFKRPGFPPGLFDGGYPEAERKLVYFDLPASPVALLEIRAQSRHSDKAPSHRDYLGALLGLGIKRETLGDLLVFPQGAGAWVFCQRRVADYIVNTLDFIGRTPVKCIPIDALPPEASAAGEQVRITVSSIRLDSLVAAAFLFSRSESLDLIKRGLVFVNGALIKKPGFEPEIGCKITVRGTGRFWLREIQGRTQKGRIAVVIEK